MKNYEENKYETECKCNTDKHIKGIRCDVCSCVYHNGQSQCCAGEIYVGPHDAKSSANTECSTFKPKEY